MPPSIEEIRKVEREILAARERQYRQLATGHAGGGYGYYHHYAYPGPPTDATFRIEIGPGDRVVVEGDPDRVMPVSIRVGGGRIVIQKITDDQVDDSQHRHS